MSVRSEVTVLCPRPIWARIMAITKATPKEVGGAFTVEDLGSGYLRIKDLVGIKQEVSGADVDFDHATFKDFLVANGWWDSPMPHATWGIWHSHNTMQAFESATDKAMIARMVSRGYLVNLIVNHKSEVVCFVDTLLGEGPIESKYLRVRIPSTLVIEEPDQDAINAFAKTYLSDFVTERAPIVVGKGYQEWNPKTGKWDAPEKGGGASAHRPFAQGKKDKKKTTEKKRTRGGPTGPTAGGKWMFVTRLEDAGSLFRDEDHIYWAWYDDDKLPHCLGTDDFQRACAEFRALLVDDGTFLTDEETAKLAAEILSSVYPTKDYILKEAANAPGNDADKIVTWFFDLPHQTAKDLCKPGKFDTLMGAVDDTTEAITVVPLEN